MERHAGPAPLAEIVGGGDLNIARDHVDPKNQHPELRNFYNAKKTKGERIRVFPISNWTELDIWQYIALE